MDQPLWQPGEERAAATAIRRFAARQGFEGPAAVGELWRWSIDDRAGFFHEVHNPTLLIFSRSRCEGGARKQ